MPEEGNEFIFSESGEYGLVYTVTDGERTISSPTVRVMVYTAGLVIEIR